MSDGIKVDRIALEGIPIPSTVSVDATYTGDDADFDGTPGEGGQDQWKQPCRCATTASVTISTALNAGDSIDGVTLVAGDRVLVAYQATASQNGIYVAGTTPERAPDMDDDDEVLGAVVYVIDGTANAGTVWTCINVAATVVDTDDIDWAQLSGGGGGGTPATTVEDETTWGITPAVGTDTEYARQDHTHGTPADPGSGGASGYDLDTYSIDATYGDDFTGASLDAKWTRRNFTGGAETYQVGKAGTYMRIAGNGRSAGDGYFETAPSGDWTFAMAYIPRNFDSTAIRAWGLACIDSSGNGVVATIGNGTPSAFDVLKISGYSSYASVYYEAGLASSGPNVSYLDSTLLHRKHWIALRKSGTDFYVSFSLDGEVWSPESGPLSYSFTVDRVGFMLPALGSTSTNSYIDMDWFNKIA